MSGFDPPRGEPGAGFPFFPFLSFLPTAERQSRGERAGVVIAVCAQKGGVGKTTTAVNLAVGLAESGENARVLLVDADPQGHASACLPQGNAAELKQQPTDLGELLLRHSAELLDAVWPTEIDGVHLVPAGKQLAETEKTLQGRIGKETVLRTALDVTRTHFDYVVIDCPPSLSTLAVAALVACDGVLIPCELSPLTVRGLRDLVQVLAEVHQRLNDRLQLLGVLVNRLDGRNSRVNADALEELELLAGDLLLETTVRATTIVPRAQAQGLPLLAYAPRNPAAEDYRNLVGEVQQRLEQMAADASSLGTRPSFL